MKTTVKLEKLYIKTFNKTRDEFKKDSAKSLKYYISQVEMYVIQNKAELEALRSLLRDKLKK